MGDPEPKDVLSLADYRKDGYDPEFDFCWKPYWGRTISNGWKGYDNGDKVYLDWDELTRRYGPLREQEDA